MQSLNWSADSHINDRLKEALAGLTRENVKWNILEKDRKNKWVSSACLGDVSIKNGTIEYSLSTVTASYIATEEASSDPMHTDRALTTGTEFEIEGFQELAGVQPLTVVTNTQTVETQSAITRTIPTNQANQSQNRRTPEKTAEDERLQTLSLKEWDEVQLTRLGWDSNVFIDGKLKLKEEPLIKEFSKSVRKLCNFEIVPASIEGILGSNGQLRFDWQEALKNHIQTVIFKKEVKDLRVDHVIEAFNELNVNLSQEDCKKIKEQLMAVINQFTIPLDGSENKVSDWTEKQVTHWCNQIKKLTSRTAKEEKLVPILAVAMRAVELANTKGYIPRATQLISALASLNAENKKGRLLQIGTGEGKSITTVLIASVRALWGDKVDIGSSSEVLSSRDGIVKLS